MKRRPQFTTRTSLTAALVVASFLSGVVFKTWLDTPVVRLENDFAAGRVNVQPIPDIFLEPAPDDYAFLGKHGNVRIGWLRKSLVNDVAQVKGACKSIDSGQGDFCEILFWTDRRLAPAHNWPMDDRQQAGVKVTYWRNSKTGARVIEWPDGRQERWPLRQ